MNSLSSAGLAARLADLPGVIGTKLGPTEWTEMTQDAVNSFADLTNDHNFIHVDAARAARTPFGGTIAHGFFTLALIAPIAQLLTVTDASTSINYGMDKVRFPAPLPVGQRWRGVAEIVESSEIKGGAQVKIAASIEVEDSDRPAVAAELLVRYYA